jgi:hypothetical protein
VIINNINIPIGTKIQTVIELLGKADGINGRGKALVIHKYGNFQISSYVGEVIRINKYDAEGDMIEYETENGHWLKKLD